MDYHAGKNYYGFLLERKEFIKEINVNALLFLHEKSGARLLKFECENENKFFSITFKTPPEDNTGTPHILEHSVLCGSRKFNTKEPFVELLKGSLSTFLNAITFSDKTMYPVASKNEKDFFNLIDVYLDAVFYPNIIKDPLIFMQEGWHYELNDKKDPIIYKGVVYNEMKGAFSSPLQILYKNIQSSLFPDTVYSFESGGEPQYIPSLTYEKFINYHKKYYHPSNSYIYLYGNGDTEKELKFIDKKYLNGFDKEKIDINIKTQKAFSKPLEKKEYYPILKNEDNSNKTFISLNYATGKSTDPELIIALLILEQILIESTASPLRIALLESGICEDILGGVDTDILQPYFSIIIKGSNKKNKNKFKKVVESTLKKLAKNGIDKDIIEAGINSIEFRLKESDFGYPKGLGYNIIIMTSWLYNEDPLIHLKFGKSLKIIKSQKNNRYFENLINKYLLNNNHMNLFLLEPKKGLQKKLNEKTKKQLEDYKKSLSEDEINKIILNTNYLKEKQNLPDTPEALKSIPMLSLNDIKKKPDEIKFKKINLNEVITLYHPDDTNGIYYLNMLFSTDIIDQEDLPYISLLSDLLGEISTEKHNYSELSNMINIHTGGISFFHEVFVSKDNDNEYKPYFIIKTKFLSEKIDHALNIIDEIINHSIFNEKKRINEIILETKSDLDSSIKSRGDIFARRRLYSYFSQSGMYNEIINGISYYQFLKSFLIDFNKKYDEITGKLHSLVKKIFNKNNLLIGITTDENDFTVFNKNISLFINNLNRSLLNKKIYNFNITKLNEGFVSPSQVQYVTKGFNLARYGLNYSGKLQVLRTIVSLDYLWNKVRVLGGAYGAFFHIERNGRFSFSSYRDPNLLETLNIFNNVYKYLKNFTIDEREMNKYIIGTIGSLDKHLTPSQKGWITLRNYIRNISRQDFVNEWNEVLSFKQNDIKNIAEIMKNIINEDYICVFGNAQKIKTKKELFNNIVNIFE